MQRPRVKSVFPPIPVGGGIIRIGGMDFGLAAEIGDDDRGHVFEMLSQMDGTRTQEQIVESMLMADPDLSASEVLEAIRDLEATGYLEDAGTEPPGSLSTVELERYRRNLDFFSYFHFPPLNKYDFQLRLKSARVTVLGIGGLGSYAALSLAAAGVGDLLLVDDDIVEPSNLNRQVLYSSRDVGRRKVDAAVERIAEVNPHVKVTGSAVRVRGVADAWECFDGKDMVICAADRPRVLIYDWLNRAAVGTGVAWMRGANDGLTVNMFMHLPGATACFDCEQSRALDDLPWYSAALRYAMEVIGDRTVNPCTSPVAGLIGNLVALEAVKYLTGIATPASLGHKLTLDLQTMSTSRHPGKRRPGCPVCSHLVADGLELAR